MTFFSGWVRERHLAIPVIINNDPSAAHFCQFSPNPHFIPVPFPRPIDPAEVFESAAAALPNRWNTPTGNDDPSLWQYDGPIRFAVYINCLFVSRERNLTKVAKAHFMPQHLIERLGYQESQPAYFETATEAEWYLGQLYPKLFRE